jgi:hypothetical protein
LKRIATQNHVPLWSPTNFDASLRSSYRSEKTGLNTFRETMTSGYIKRFGFPGLPFSGGRSATYKIRSLTLGGLRRNDADLMILIVQSRNTTFEVTRPGTIILSNSENPKFHNI